MKLTDEQVEWLVDSIRRMNTAPEACAEKPRVPTHGQRMAERIVERRGDCWLMVNPRTFHHFFLPDDMGGETMRDYIAAGIDMEIAAERERCATVIEDMHPAMILARENVVAAIRAGGTR